MPYGYRFSEETNNFEIDPETEPYVRMVFAWILAGVSRSEIANRMNLLNISSPGKLRYDKKNNWRSETVRYIQINPAYAGIHVMGKTEKRKCDGIDSHKVRREDWVRYGFTRSVHYKRGAKDIRRKTDSESEAKGGAFGASPRHKGSNAGSVFGESVLRGLRQTDALFARRA